MFFYFYGVDKNQFVTHYPRILHGKSKAKVKPKLTLDKRDPNLIQKDKIKIIYISAEDSRAIIDLIMRKLRIYPRRNDIYPRS